MLLKGRFQNFKIFCETKTAFTNSTSSIQSSSVLIFELNFSALAKPINSEKWPKTVPLNLILHN